MIKAEEIAEAAEFLLKQPDGCFFKKIFIPSVEYDWGIVIGWSGGFDETQKTPFSDGEYRICTKIAYNNSALQSDYELDFTMPYNKETGEVYDTNTELESNLKAAALRLNREFEEVANFFGLYNE